ncbi:(2Fe-2S)-binding protein [Streptomyces johnsoniae]|uniref:(2Fe-2S)-binding protein n=1 Tax=Streptomyces johnsoniae TaxID=3075532 RepID=A0ABU2S703_9ACTN|nr:(2Fe-2S)-binding protein [Streptomyces sp. DSM 41886]MDT0444762.1 (2Fe-2S)-binding protein [Streptomyces sp. DSM 41886]
MAQQHDRGHRPAPGSRTSPADLALTFDGTPLTARPGQSVGAALTDHGIKSWRGTRKEGAPRGLFCGIGICYDCLITVDGVPNQRACLVPARDGMELSSAPPELPLPGRLVPGATAADGRERP